MPNLLGGDYTSVLEARTVDELHRQVLRFVRALGFETFGAMVAIDRMGDSEFISLHNVPDAYLEAYLDNDLNKRDPVSQHCKHHSVPLVWDQSTYLAAGLEAKYEHQAGFGFRCGIAWAMHLPGSLHFMLGVDRDQSLPASSAEIARMTADLQLFAVHAQDAAMRVLSTSHRQEAEPKLTPRELECLRWTMEGKTAWELGRILGIAEQTAVRHLHNASHKLGCINKHQAVLKALRLELIR
jgi:DNA-binding CsgD family transcriptional regulator